MKKTETKLELAKKITRLRARVAALAKSKRERGRVEEALREADQFRQEVISGAGAGIAVYDREFRYLVWNQFMEDLTGVPAAQVLSKQALDLFPHLRQHGVDRLLERAFAGEIVSSADIPYRIPQTGKSGWGIGTYSPRRDAKGKIIGVVAMIHDITARKQVEEALQKSEQYARSIIDSSLDMIITVDDQRQIVEFNKAAQKTFGYTREEVLGKHISILYADPAEGQAVHQATFERGRNAQEVINKRKNGETFASFVSAAIMRDSQGELLGVVGVSRDVTERKRAEEALKESEERYRDLFENANDFIQAIAPDGRFLYVNRAWREALGYNDEEIAQLSLFDIVAPENRQHCQALLQQVMTGEELDQFEVTFVAKDGREIAVEGRVNCKFVDGKPVSTRGIFRDITERKHTLEAMLLEKARFQQLFDNSPIGIAMLDAEDRIQSINSAFQRIFQYDPAEAAGRPINDLITPNDQGHLGDRVQEASQLSSQALNGVAVEMETERRRKDGTLVPVVVYGVPIVRDGKPMGAYGIYADISELKRMEGKLKREVDKFSALHEIDQALSTLDLRDCLKIIAQRARALFATDVVAILLREGDHLRLVAEDGMVTESKQVLIPLGSGITGWCGANRKSLLVPDVRRDSRYLDYYLHTCAEMAAPLLVHDDCIGVLNVESAQVNAFVPDDLALLESLAARAAAAIHNARLHSAEREHRQFAETLRDIGMALTSELDPDAVIDLLLDEVARVLPYDTAAVMLLNDGIVRTKRQRGYEKYGVAQHMENFEMPIGALPNLSRMATSGKPQLIPDTRKDPLWVETESSRHIRSWLGAPIIARGKILGVLTLQKVEPDFYAASMEERLAIYATQAGIAMENARLYADQQQLAMTDSLTGLFNRRHFVQLAEREFQRARRLASPFAVLMIDLDDFKQVNDKFGHSVGDEALQLVAKTLSKNVRVIDVVARYGGDEFVVLLPDCRDREAQQVTARLQERFRTVYLRVENQDVKLSFSVGIASSTLAPAETLDRLLIRADAEMYETKQKHEKLAAAPERAEKVG